MSINLNYDIYRFDRIDSTNSYLIGLGEEGFPEGTVVLADEQSGGRGRFGRKWEAEPLSNLLFSLLLRPGFLQPDEVFILTFASALAVGDAIETATQVTPVYKWPNDVLMGAKKVCGVLLESSFSGDKLEFVVAGIGLNVNQKVFSPEISDRATSLLLATGRTHDRDEILFSILKNFSALYDVIEKRDFYSIMSRWRKRADMIGKKVQITLAGKTVEGICDEVADDGSVVIRSESGIRKFSAGEITIGGTY